MANISTAPEGVRTAEDHRRAIAQEYGQYVAVEQITVDGALAFDVGHPVPVSHVEKYDLLATGAVQRAGGGEVSERLGKEELVNRAVAAGIGPREELDKLTKAQLVEDINKATKA